MAAITFSSNRSGWAGALVLLVVLWSLWAMMPSQAEVPIDLYNHVVPNKDTGRPYTDSPLDDGYKGVMEGNMAAPPPTSDIDSTGEHTGVMGSTGASLTDGPGDGSWRTPAAGDEHIGSSKPAGVADITGDASWITPEGTNEVGNGKSHDVHHPGDTLNIATSPSLSAPESKEAVSSPNSVPSTHSSDHAVAHAPEQHDKKTDRPLITYVYFEGPVARDNIMFFIKHGLHNSADFLFIINGESDIVESIPTMPNIAIHTKENDCFDLGSHAMVLQKDDLWKKYKKFILMNASIRGPFFPVWANECWTDMFLSRVNDNVKLVGISGNCWSSFHVQSMIWATDSIGLELLLQPEAIGKCFHDWQTAVDAEVGATSVIRNAGYKVDTMLTAFQADTEYIEHCDNSVSGDYLVDKGYFGSNVHPFETIFMKTNRNIDPDLMHKLTEWIDARNYSSYDVC